MKTSSILVLGLAANTFAFAPQQVLSSLGLSGSSYQCDNGMYISMAIPRSIANGMQARSHQLSATMRLTNTTALVLVPTASSLINLSILSPPPPTEAVAKLSAMLNARPIKNSVLNMRSN